MADGGERVGTRFGQYRIDALLGSGGMGAVYRAYDTVRDREVALKVLHSQFAKDPTYQERFRRECRTLAKLGEPHVIPIHDFGEIDGVLYLDMRLVEGRDLRAVLRERGALAPADAVALIEQVAAALDAAHAVGLVHRDVKPENILVTDANFAYLVDFGIAHQTNDSHLTQAGSAIGSIAYMAPEVFDNQQPGPGGDVYSLAAVLFECLTGQQPYPGDSVSTVLRQVVLQGAPVVSRVNPAVPAAFDPVLAGGLAKDPAHRYPSAGAFAAAAKEALTAPAGGDHSAYQATEFGRSAPQPIPTAPYAPQFSGPYSQPQQVPAYQPSQPVAVAPDGGGGGSSNVMVAVLVTLIVVLVLGLGGFLIYKFAGFGGDDQVATTRTSTQTVPAPAGSAESDAGEDPSTRTPGSAPSWSESCGYGHGRLPGSPTSCQFAEQVMLAYNASGRWGEARTVRASSPVTHNSYAMSCVPRSGIVVCTGGDHAEVHLY